MIAFIKTVNCTLTAEAKTLNGQVYVKLTSDIVDSAHWTPVGQDQLMSLKWIAERVGGTLFLIK